MSVLLAVVGNSDKTPDSVNWADVGPGTAPQSNANQTMQNFDGSITLEANFTGTGLVYYSINDGTFTLVTSGGQFSVSDGDTVKWQVTSVAPGNYTGTVTVTNESDGSATLDTFTYDVTESV